MKKNLLLALSLLAISAPSFAAQDACHSDAALLCPGQTWAKGLGACLKKNSSRLSSACQASVSKHHSGNKDQKAGKSDQNSQNDQANQNNQNTNPDKYAHLKDSCGSDIQKLCSGVQPGKGRVYACLQGHTDELSPSCKDELGNKKS